MERPRGFSPKTGGFEGILIGGLARSSPPMRAASMFEPLQRASESKLLPGEMGHHKGCFGSWNGSEGPWRRGASSVERARIAD